VPFYIDTFSDASVAKKAGMIKDDKIIAVNDVKTEFFDEFRNEIFKYKNKEVTIKVLRNTDTLNYTMKLDSTGLLGVVARQTYKILDFVHIDYSFAQALPAGIMKGFNGIRDYLAQFKLLIRPKTKAYESLGGFITIGKIFPGVWDWQAFWNLTAFLSLILAIMNILPIPALDGGHVMFLLYEIVTGRKPGDKFLEYAQIVGMVLLFSLLIYVNANDIIKLFK
jgi:regulator of sigma E protease